MTYTWQEAIERDLNDPNYGPRQVWSYILPRQVGATTFLRNLAFEEAENGSKVWVLSRGRPNDFVHYYNHPNIRGRCTMEPLSTFNVMEWVRPGYTPMQDFIIIDGIPRSGLEPIEYSIDYLKNYGRKIIRIDTDIGR